MKLSPRKFSILLLSLLLLGIGLTLIVYYGFYLREVRTIPYDFHIKQGVAGLNAETDALHFGTLGPGGTSQRTLNVTPTDDCWLVVSFEGNGSSYLRVEKNKIPLNAGEPLQLVFTVVVPSDAQLGNYSGTARFFFYRR